MLDMSSLHFGDQMEVVPLINPFRLGVEAGGRVFLHSLVRVVVEVSHIRSLKGHLRYFLHQLLQVD